MPEHRIRLNRAWEIRAAPLNFDWAQPAAAALLSEVVEERFDLPLAVDGDPAGDDGRPVRLLLSRWFNAPSNLRPGQPVRVLVEPAAIVSQMRLNADELRVEPASGRSVTGETPVSLEFSASFDVTDKLQPHNRLDILVGDPADLSSASIVLVIDGDPV